MSDAVNNQDAPAFDPRAAKQIHDWAYTARLLKCRVDPTGKFVFAGAVDYTVQRWEIASGTRTDFRGHDNWVSALGFSPDGVTHYSGSYDGRLLFWETAAATPQPQRTIAAHEGWLRGLDVSTDGKWIATCGNDKRIKIWSAEDGTLVRELSGHPHFVFCLRFRPDSHELVSGDIVGNIYHWNGDDGALIRKFELKEMYSNIGDLAPFGGIISLTFSPDQKKLTASGLYKVSNAPAGGRRAVATSFDWQSGAKLGYQESIKKEVDATMWRALYHPSGHMIGVLEKSFGFWMPGEEDLYHSVETASDIFDMDLHPNHVDLFTAHFDGHVRCTKLAAVPSS